MNKAKKSDFIKKLTKKQIVNFLEIVISQVSDFDPNAKVQEMDTYEGRQETYNLISKHTFDGNNSKLNIFLLIFFDTADLKSLRTDLLVRHNALEVALRNGQYKLKMPLSLN